MSMICLHAPPRVGQPIASVGTSNKEWAASRELLKLTPTHEDALHIRYMVPQQKLNHTDTLNA